MFEQSKAAKRRYNIGNFHSKYFVGSGIDVGAGQDSLLLNINMFRGIVSVRSWDIQDGDAQYMETIEDDKFDFLHSSHCLEHMVDPSIALINWIRITKPGGYLVITIPEETMYEHDQWPSKFNSDHKWSFRLKHKSSLPKSINVYDLAQKVLSKATAVKVELIDEFYNPQYVGVDQTMFPNSECSIEIILRKND